MTSKLYHKEIDGLRAISVFVIILFHLKVSFFQGGVVMVDVFFVLSGYLITQIICSGLESGKFTFKEFFVRRSTRILPALIAAIMLTLLAATYLQQPVPLAHTAKETLAALFSVSNIFFWTEASYWAPSSEKYPLLHTWSLGVEEQFYLIYPFFLFVCHRLGGMRGVAIALGVVLVVGLYSTEQILKTDRSAAFYLTPLRFFEFAVGGLGGLIATRTSRLLTSIWMTNALTLLGLGCILYSIVVFHPRLYDLPGVASLLPTVGAVLVMLAGASPIARVALSNPIMSWLGTTSYSIYLVHWPIIVFYRNHYGGSLSALEKTGLFIAILLAGELLARGVERRFRLVGKDNTTATGIPARSVLLGILGSTIVLAIACSILIENKGWPSRMPQEAQALLEITPRQDMRKRKALYKEQCTPKGALFCGQRQAGSPNILLIGDSRVLDIYISLKTAYPEVAIQSSYAMGCAPVFSPAHSINIFYPDCAQFNLSRLQVALEAPPEDIIFLAHNVTEWISEAALETVKRLRETGKQVYILGQFDLLEDRSALEVAIDAHRFKSSTNNLPQFMVANPYSMDAEFADKIRATGAVYISNKAFFFDGEYHLTDRETGKLLTFDGRHLNYYGAHKFGEYLQERYPLQ
jgi:peptidoglycan/LPS O-acetylase OafA/YrhL